MTLGDGKADLVGQVVARKYRVKELVGEGSMGRIYLAEHLGLEKKVALKVLHPEVLLGPEGIQRFRREGVAAGKLSHPNAIEMFDFDVTEAGDAFLAMEFIEGRDLRKVLEEDGPMDLEEAQEVILQALDAIGAAHDLGIIHRDVKPENIMLTETSGGPRVTVLDFGLSKLIDTTMGSSLSTVPGRLIGTPFYMAPEQASGEEADTRTDLYALGVIFFELLAGQRPFTGKNLTELLYAQATQDAPSLREYPGLEGIPDWADQFVERALEVDRGDRYQSAAAMSQDLLEESVEERELDPDAKRTPTPRSTRRARTPRPPQPKERPKWLIPAAAVGAAALVGAILFAMKDSGGSAGPGGTPPPVGSGSAGSGQASADSPRLRPRGMSSLNEAEKSYLSILDSARTKIASGKLPGARALVDTVMGLPQVDAEAFLLRGALYSARGNADSAATDLREAIFRDPAYAEAHAALGWVELDRGATEAAAGHFETALGIDSSYGDALAGQGALLAAKGEVDEAQAAFRRSVESDRDCWRGHVGLGDLMVSAGTFDTAIDSYQNAKRIRPEDPAVLLGLARAYRAAGRADDAVPMYLQVLGSDSDQKEAQNGLVAAYFDAERYGDVVDFLQPIVRRGNAPGELRALLGVAHFEIGNYEGAERALTRAVESGFRDARPQALLACIKLEAGEAQAALELADAALDDDPRSADGHLFRGLALFQLEQFDDASDALRRAVNLDPTCAPAWFTLADLGRNYLADGRQVRNDLLNYLELGGEDPRAEVWFAEFD